MTIENKIKHQSFDLGLGDYPNQYQTFEKIKNTGLQNITFLKKHLNKPDYNKPKKSFLLSDVVNLTGISRSSITDKEKSGKLPYVNKHQKFYSLSDVNLIRKVFNKGFFDGSVTRPSHLQPITIAFSMFKGGVGKTTQATHLAAHCAIYGLKVLLIDLDPQASATFVYGYIPSVDINSGNTMFNPLLEDPASIKDIIKPTHYDGLDIITSGLELQGADIMLPNSSLNNSAQLGSPLLRLHHAMGFIKNAYDLIILDCAPNHAATTMNALVAADGIILPVTPNMLSYGSSIQFIQTLLELSSLFTKRPENSNSSRPIDLTIDTYTKNHINKLFRILLTNDPGDIEAQDVTEAIRALYRNFVLPRPMNRTIALSRSSNEMGLLYDLKRQDVRGSKESFDRGLAAMKAVNDDIVTLLRTLWNLTS